MKTLSLAALLLVSPLLASPAGAQESSRLSADLVVETGYASWSRLGHESDGVALALGVRVGYPLGGRRAGRLLGSFSRTAGIYPVSADRERYYREPSSFFGLGPGSCVDREVEPYGEGRTVAGAFCDGGAIALGATTVDAAYEVPGPVPLAVGVGGRLGSTTTAGGRIQGPDVRPYLHGSLTAPVSGRVGVTASGQVGRGFGHVRAGVAVRLRGD